MQGSERKDGQRRLSAAERRERILAAATEIFAERGYVAASMGEIARQAGIVPSVIYDHFGSKRELHIELLELHGEAIIRETISEIRRGEPQQVLRDSIDAYFRFVQDDPFVWRFLFRDPPADPEIAAAYRRIQDRATAGIADLVRSTAPPDASLFGLRAETEGWMVAKASQSAINGLAQWWWENREVPREQVVEVAVSMLWDGMGALLSRSVRRSPRAAGARAR